MRSNLAITKSVASLSGAYEALQGRDAGVPGMALVHGYSGAGKTTAITWLCNRTKGVYVRALRMWTPNSMLAKVMGELKSARLNSNAAMVEFIASKLMEQDRPLFVDEADYLLSDGAMIETLRDIHDISGAPVVLVGMKGIELKFKSRPQLERRISHWVEFLPSDLEDARTLADTVCEVKLDDELLERLYNETSGSVGLMVVGMSRIEALAKANGWKAVGSNQWGDRKLFLGA